MDDIAAHNNHTKVCFSLWTVFLLQKSQIDPRETLVTCGNISDPRIRLGVDVAQALTLIFRSDSSVAQNRGVNLTIIEINTTAANVSDYIHLNARYNNVSL